MGFRRQVQHDIGPVRREGLIQRRAVADIGLHKAIPGVIRHRCHIGQIGGIVQRIEIHDRIATCYRGADDGGPDEPGATRDKDFHSKPFQIMSDSSVEIFLGFMAPLSLF